MSTVGWICNLVILTLVLINAARPGFKGGAETVTFLGILMMCVLGAVFLVSVRPW